MARIAPALVILLLIGSWSCGGSSGVGEATGVIEIPSEGIRVELKYAYARKIQSEYGPGQSVLLTDRRLTREQLRAGKDLSEAGSQISSVHLIVDAKGLIRKLQMVATRPGVSFSPSEIYPEVEQRRVTVEGDRIEGEFHDRGSLGAQKQIDWMCAVSFKTTIPAN